MNINSYDGLGNSGIKLMNNAISTSMNAANRVVNSTNPMDIAKTSMDISEAKVQMAVGAYLVKSQNELMETSLQLLMPYGVGTNLSMVA